MKDRHLAPHVRAAISGLQTKPRLHQARPMASHVLAAIQAKPAPAGPAGKAPPAAVAQCRPAPTPPSPPGLGSARAIQRAEDPNASKPTSRFWVLGDQGQYEWHEEEADLDELYPTGQKYASIWYEYPVFKELPKELKRAQMATGIDHSKWDPLAAPLGDDLIKKGLKPTVEHLFKKFCASQGTGYDVMGRSSPWVFDKGLSDYSSCIGLANSFRVLLAAHGIETTVEEVRTDQQPPFIVQVLLFIDRRVSGHIYLDNVCLNTYYKFTNHAAVWVEKLGLFYDPMATKSYAQLDVDAELKEVEQGTFVSIKGKGPMKISQGRPFKLVKTKKTEPGSFVRLDMTIEE